MKRNSSDLIGVSGWLLIPLLEMGRNGGQGNFIYSAMMMLLFKSKLFFVNFVHIWNILWLYPPPFPPFSYPWIFPNMSPFLLSFLFYCFVFHFVQIRLPVYARSMFHLLEHRQLISGHNLKKKCSFSPSMCQLALGYDTLVKPISYRWQIVLFSLGRAHEEAT